MGTEVLLETGIDESELGPKIGLTKKARMTSMMTLSDSITKLQDEIVQFRRTLHSHPEPGFQEWKTKAFIKAKLEGLGASLQDCAKTGLIVDFGGGSGPTIALRADMDALTMTEANLDLPYRSQHQGFAHMCGHDGHSAALVGTALLLSKVADSLPGRVRLLFQPAEEGLGGAKVMIAEGALDGVDEVYGMHNWPQVSLGQLRTIAGPCMGSIATFKAHITGVGGHSSQPQETIDPVLTAAHCVVALQSVVSRSIAARDPGVLSVTMIHSGEANNVIPETALIEGTLRAVDDSVMDTLLERLETIIQGTAQIFGATVSIETDRMYPAVINSPEQTAHVQAVGRSIFGEQAVSDQDLPILAAEDFSFFLHKKPGCFFFLGTAEPDRNNATCHSPNYDFNDRVLPLAMKFWIRLLEQRFGTRLYA